MVQTIYKNGCWGCKKAHEDPQERYVCPKAQQHWKEYQKQEKEILRNEIIYS